MRNISTITTLNLSNTIMKKLPTKMGTKDPTIQSIPPPLTIKIADGKKVMKSTQKTFCGKNVAKIVFKPKLME